MRRKTNRTAERKKFIKSNLREKPIPEQVKQVVDRYSDREGLRSYVLDNLPSDFGINSTPDERCRNEVMRILEKWLEEECGVKDFADRFGYVPWTYDPSSPEKEWRNISSYDEFVKIYQQVAMVFLDSWGTK